MATPRMKKAEIQAAMEAGEPVAVDGYTSSRIGDGKLEQASRGLVVAMNQERRYTTSHGLASYHQKSRDGILVRLLDKDKEAVFPYASINMLWSEYEAIKAQREAALAARMSEREEAARLVSELGVGVVSENGRRGGYAIRLTLDEARQLVSR
jgi:hypothetical protein